MATRDTEVENLIINELTKAEFETATKSDTELYFVTDEKISAEDIEGLKTINGESIVGEGNIEIKGGLDAGRIAEDIANIKSHIVIDTYVNGTSGYRVWSDGYCEQTFFYTPPNSSAQTIQLLKQYRDTNYVVQATYHTNNWNYPLTVYNKTTSNFGLTTKSTWLSNDRISLFACGYLKEGEY